MASEQEKGLLEVSIFQQFAQAAGFVVQSVEKQSPHEGKPDLKCQLDGEQVYFELTEACSEDVARSLANMEERLVYDLSSIKDYTSETYKKKTSKRYVVSEPVDLLIYNVGRTILPDEILVNNLRALAEKDRGQFRKVWYFGENIYEL